MAELARHEQERGPSTDGAHPVRAVPPGHALLPARLAAVDAAAPTPRIRSAAFSATAMVGALVLPRTIDGMIEASTTRSPSTPWTRRSEPTTAASSDPIRHVPAGW